jgi:glutathionylspermidine synthase
MEEPEIARHGRVYKKSNWTLMELQVLQAAKREDQDKQLKADPKEKHKSAAERWQWMEDYCWAHAVERSAQQCRDRWERMSADFKKVGDFEKHNRSGPSYWQMSIDERKHKKLPSNFQQEVFHSLLEWFVRSRTSETIDNDAYAPLPLQGRH